MASTQWAESSMRCVPTTICMCVCVLLPLHFVFREIDNMFNIRCEATAASAMMAKTVISWMSETELNVINKYEVFCYMLSNMTNRIDVITVRCTYLYKRKWPDPKNKPIRNSILNIIVCGVDFEACQYNLIQWLSCRLHCRIGLNQQNCAMHFFSVLNSFSFQPTRSSLFRQIFRIRKEILKLNSQERKTETITESLKQFAFIKMKCLYLLPVCIRLKFYTACGIPSVDVVAAAAASIQLTTLYCARINEGLAMLFTLTMHLKQIKSDIFAIQPIEPKCICSVNFNVNMSLLY